MPLPANFHSTVEQVLEAYPQTLATVTCDKTCGKGVCRSAAVSSHVAQEQRCRCRAGELLGGHWAVYPPSPADYFVRCLVQNKRVCGAVHSESV